MQKSKMYACIVFFPNDNAKRWKYVRNLQAFSIFLLKEHSLWKYFNVYDKGSKKYLKRFYPFDQIPKVLFAILAVT